MRVKWQWQTHNHVSSVVVNNIELNTYYISSSWNDICNLWEIKRRRHMRNCIARWPSLHTTSMLHRHKFILHYMAMLSVSLDFPFLIAPLSFSQVYHTDYKIVFSELYHFQEICSWTFLLGVLCRVFLVFGISVTTPQYSSYERTLFEHFYIVFYFRLTYVCYW